MTAFAFIFAPAVALSLASGQAGATAPGELVTAVLQSNPELVAVEQQIEALEHQVSRAGVWQDPSVAIEYSNMPVLAPWPGNHPMSGVQLKLQQMFPAPGKIGAREALARGRVEVARQELDERRNQLAGDVLDLYYRLTLARQLQGITEEHIGLVSQLIDVARVSYSAGRSAQHDLMQLEVLRKRLQDDVWEYERQDRQIEASLNAALHRAPGAAITTPTEVEASRPSRSIEELVAEATEYRPLVKQLVAAAAAEELGAERAAVEGRPDVTAWLGYRVRLPSPGGDPGDNFATVGAAIPITWLWNDRRWGELAREHDARQRSYQAKRDAVIDDIRGQIESTLVAWQRSQDQADYYRDQLVVDQRKTLDATLAAYSVGQAGFASLYAAELELLRFERVIRIARVQAARSSVRTATLTGQHLRTLDKEGV